jgi:formylglycine-generating enzyme required for sulfatase activity
MVHITHDYCPDMQRQCDKSEYDRSNRITICHQFKAGSNVCPGKREPLDYCIDRFEFPNEPGGHPPVMVDFHDAALACEERSKRLCRESEWVTACEGPGETPFPYGWQRSNEACNIDNPWINPSLDRLYSKRPEVSQAEVERLDQSVPSGAKTTCVSGYDVFDLTGNFDEWVRLDTPKPKARSKYAGLKGGAWGHVRNACRPVTTSHAPEFKYYFVSFRCCSDIAGEESSGGAARAD